MALGYDGKLYLLAFDHRESFVRDMFSIIGEPTPEQVDAIRDVKRLIFEGTLDAVGRGADPNLTGVVVDEQFGAEIPARAREHGLRLAMPVERSGLGEFDFEYGDDFGAHVERFDPDLAKVLVRYNPEGEDQELNERQRARLRTLSAWLRARGRKLLFELLVPPTEPQLERAGGDTSRYDAELRPDLMRSAIGELQDASVEVDVWKLEGVEHSEDAAMLVEQARSGEGREGVVCIVLGRAGSDEQIDHWLRQAAAVEGFAGFAIGRSIWWGALRGFLLQSLPRGQARDQIAANYLRFIDVYERHERE
ncbi:MAG TPA: DUF2090 domain-containing protein [Solirubrobacteraceae bacterium]|nr:DUF2090 domain-containing protein [Solirubrobacteraceae bacterium]